MQVSPHASPLRHTSQQPARNYRRSCREGHGHKQCESHGEERPHRNSLRRMTRDTLTVRVAYEPAETGDVSPTRLTPLDDVDDVDDAGHSLV